MYSKFTLPLWAIIILLTSGCQNSKAISVSPISTPAVIASPVKSLVPKTGTGEPITVGSQEIVETLPVRSPLPEPSASVPEIAPTSLAEVSTNVLATETSVSNTFLAGTPTPILTPQSIITPILSASANSVSPTPVLYPTTTWRPSQIATVDIPDDWLTYVDEGAGYSFKYPSKFHLSAGINKGDKFKHVLISFPPSEEFHPWMTVTVKENINNISTEQYLIEKYIKFTKQPIAPSEYLAAMETITMNGFPAVWSKADGVSEVFIVINAQGKFFNFSISNGIIVSDLRTVDDASKDVFYQIVNTFTLLPE